MRPPLRGLGRLLLVSGAALVLTTGAVTASAPALASPGTDTLWAASNETLAGAQNQSLFSPNRRYEARMQSDGNFVVHGPAGPRWTSNTTGARSRLVMRSDGNLVLHSDRGVLFSTNTAGRGGNRLVLRNDGNLVLLGTEVIWASDGPGEHAIRWFHDHSGSAAYEGRNDLAITRAFGTPAATTRTDWQRPHTAAPRGTVVRYGTGAAGHLAVSLGDGRVCSTGVAGRIGSTGISDFADPLGWAPR